MKLCACSVAHARKVKNMMSDLNYKKARPLSCDKENATHKSKKPRLSLSLKKSRFVPICKSELENMAKPVIAKNTSISTRWAVKNLTDWHTDYNKRNPNAYFPDDVLLPTCPKHLLDKWLSVFITETRTQNGEAYPP